MTQLIEYTGHELVSAYNELGGLKEVSLATGMSIQAIEQKIKRCGYELVKEYKLLRRKDIKSRFDKLRRSQKKAGE